LERIKRNKQLIAMLYRELDTTNCHLAKLENTNSST